jgi:hypothetical protein
MIQKSYDKISTQKSMEEVVAEVMQTNKVVELF